jgi:hypothetical protein
VRRFPFVLITLTCLPALAGPPGPGRDIIRVPVWIEASNGTGAEVEASLTASDFTARLENQPAEVVGVRGPADDLMILLVLDVTEELAQVDLAKEALAAAIPKLPAHARVALLRAQDGLQVVLDPTSDRDALIHAIRSQPVSGKAGLLDTVETAGRLAHGILQKAVIRLALVYVTDSNIYNYRADYINPVINTSDQRDLSRRFPEGLVREKISKLESKLAGLEAPLFILHLDYRSDRMNEAYQSGLMQLAAAAGGSSIFCRSRAEIPDAVANAFRTIASHYSVDVRVPEQPSKIVPVQLESGGRTLSYRTRFVLQEK